MKRRSDSDECDLPAKRVHSSESVMDPSQFIRDPDYYLQDGDLVILVDKTLFKVHRFILCRDSSTFQNMLDVCTGMEGSTDENPLQLYGDAAEAVRSLLSMFYALPNDVQTKMEGFRQETGLDDLLTLIEIVNKYHFSSTEALLVKIFQDHVGTFTQRLLQNATTDTLKRALRVAVLQNEEDAQHEISWIFFGRIMKRRIPADVALEVGNAYSLRLLQGAAHYVYLMDAIAETEASTPSEVIKFGPGIDDDMKLHLLHGYYSLMRTCLQLRSTPPIDLATCQDLGIAGWHQSYRIPFDAFSPDLSALLLKIIKSLRTWCHENRVSTSLPVDHLDQELQRILTNLMDYFDPPS